MTNLCLPRYATPRTDRPNLAAVIAKVAAALGTPLLPYQLLIVQVATELDALGRLAYKQIVASLPRQSGKSTLILAVLIAYALRRPNQRFVFAAQTRLDARRRMLDDWAPTLAASPFRSLVTVRRGSGSEALIFSNGSRIGLVSGTRVGGHGEVLDGCFVDEGWAQQDDSLETAIRPTMVTRPDPQMWIVSTAGDATSTWFRNKCDAGRTSAELGIGETSCFLEWSAPPEADLSDRSLWRSFMPALAAGLVTEEAIAADQQLMSPSEFARCYGNQWADESDAGWRVIPRDVWEAAQYDEDR